MCLNDRKRRPEGGVNGSLKISQKTFRPLSQNHRQPQVSSRDSNTQANRWREYLGKIPWNDTKPTQKTEPESEHKHKNYGWISELEKYRLEIPNCTNTEPAHSTSKNGNSISRTNKPKNWAGAALSDQSQNEGDQCPLNQNSTWAILLLGAHTWTNRTQSRTWCSG
jgi:hypothetical protein